MLVNIDFFLVNNCFSSFLLVHLQLTTTTNGAAAGFIIKVNHLALKRDNMKTASKLFWIRVRNCSYEQDEPQPRGATVVLSVNNNAHARVPHQWHHSLCKSFCSRRSVFSSYKWVGVGINWIKTHPGRRQQQPRWWLSVVFVCVFVINMNLLCWSLTSAACVCDVDFSSGKLFSGCCSCCRCFLPGFVLLLKLVLCALKFVVEN